KAWEQEVLIMKLNQQIRGWTNYHQSVCASEAFSYLDYHLYELLWRWAKRRHPKKGQWWVSTKYWHRRGNRSWVFASGDKELIRVDHTAIVRHTKVRENANPYLDTEYFAQRTFNHGMKRLTGRFKLVWKKQNGRCHHCGLPMELGEDREIFFKVPKSKGGVEEVDNMAYVHSYCQRLFIESRSKE
ncbi:TPA: group II intron maturase-specific domain-containing protein, partial [Streptococcus pyogenes]